MQSTPYIFLKNLPLIKCYTDDVIVIARSRTFLEHLQLYVIMENGSYDLGRPK